MTEIPNGYIDLIISKAKECKTLEDISKVMLSVLVAHCYANMAEIIHPPKKEEVPNSETQNKQAGDYL